MTPRVFVLSPAWAGGKRAEILLRKQADFDLARRLRAGTSTIAEVYAFISGLYFRGKVAYVEAFASPPAGVPGAVAIVPGLGLIPIDTQINHDHLRQVAEVPVAHDNEAYSVPLLRDAALLDRHAGPECQYVLLGSIATEKYTQPLLTVFGERLVFPSDFVGRGDMSRGGLMLRCASTGSELAYAAVQGAERRGRRPPKLEPWPKR